HEIVRVVTEVGRKVQNFKVGDKFRVGCIVGSCRSCDSCAENLENYCPKMIFNNLSTYLDGTPAYGGYSDIMVIDQHYGIRIPENMSLDAIAPLLCAGITVYKYYGLDKPGPHIAVVGPGGLGHMAVKFAKAFGAKVTVISTSPNKKEEAIARLGANSFLVSRDTQQLQVRFISSFHIRHMAVKFAKAFGAKVTVVSTSPNKKEEAITHLGADSLLVSRDSQLLQAADGTMDVIINTVVVHALLLLINLQKTHGKLVMVTLTKRKIVARSVIGGIKET
ncbi:putative mannitol dehydrogenase, partial [Bienertia sinuspersici]